LKPGRVRTPPGAAAKPEPLHPRPPLLRSGAMTAPVTAPTRPVPEDIAAAARTWAAGLVAACGEDLEALYVYGSALGPGFDRSASDVNLLFVVRVLPFARLEAIAAAAAALPSVADQPAGTYRFTPLVLTRHNLESSADVFPIDFLDLKERRGLLTGTDLLAGLEVPLSHLRHQCEYELRSRFIGLRQAFLRSGGAPGNAHALTLRAAGASASLFRHLLTLRGQPHPEEAEGLARAVAAAWRVDADGLDGPFAARRDPAPDEATARRRFGAYLDALDQLIRAVDSDSPR